MPDPYIVLNFAIIGESQGTGAGAAGFAAAAGLAAGVDPGAEAAGFGGNGGGGGEAGFSAEVLVSDETEPETVAFTPLGTAGLSAVGFGSPSGGGVEGDLISSGISGEGANLKHAGFRRER